jgi:hypothetical protein
MSAALRLACVVLLFIVLGCGPGRGDLTGTVSYQGKALKVGSVSVLGSDGIPKTDSIRDDGTFLVRDIPAGTIKIAVNSRDPAKSQPKTRKKGAPPPKADRTGWFPIPEKYSDFAKSELSLTLNRGANSWDIELK